MKKRLLAALAALVVALALAGCAATAPRPGVLDAGDGVLRIPRSGLMWQKQKSEQFSSSGEATTYVRQLRLGGYNDWRLPTPAELRELYTLFDFGPGKFNAEGYLIEGDYWTDDHNTGVTAGSWRDLNLCEIDRAYAAGSGGAVRAVRP